MENKGECHVIPNVYQCTETVHTSESPSYNSSNITGETPNLHYANNLELLE